MEIPTNSLLIDIHKNVNTYCANLWEAEWRHTPNSKLREIKNITTYWPKPHQFDLLDEVVINKICIGHQKVSYGHLMRKKVPTLC